MKCAYVFLVAAVAFVGASPTSCFKPCPKILLPVCAFDGESYKVFNNECLMEEATCLDAKIYSLAPMSHCKQPRTVLKNCPKIYKPVCGFNGEGVKIFNNECLMEQEALTDSKPWTLTNLRDCLLRSTDKCLKPCTKIYWPVCGFNGETYKVFSNQCVMEVESCSDAKPWLLTRMDNCQAERSVAEKQCNRACPLNYAPVCGFNGGKYQIFGNMCDFESNNCMDSNVWSQLTLADCEAHGLKAW